MAICIFFLWWALGKRKRNKLQRTPVENGRTIHSVLRQFPSVATSTSKIALVLGLSKPYSCYPRFLNLLIPIIHVFIIWFFTVSFWVHFFSVVVHFFSSLPSCVLSLFWIFGLFLHLSCWVIHSLKVLEVIRKICDFFSSQ